MFHEEAKQNRSVFTKRCRFCRYLQESCTSPEPCTFTGAAHLDLQTRTLPGLAAPGRAQDDTKRAKTVKDCGQMSTYPDKVCTYQDLQAQLAGTCKRSHFRRAHAATSNTQNQIDLDVTAQEPNPFAQGTPIAQKISPQKRTIFTPKGKSHSTKRKKRKQTLCVQVTAPMPRPPMCRTLNQVLPARPF
jgi:hypothetical protein